MPKRPIFWPVQNFMGIFWLRMSRRMSSPSNSRYTSITTIAMVRKPGVRLEMVWNTLPNSWLNSPNSSTATMVAPI